MLGTSDVALLGLYDVFLADVWRVIPLAEIVGDFPPPVGIRLNLPPERLPRRRRHTRARRAKQRVKGREARGSARALKVERASGNEVKRVPI